MKDTLGRGDVIKIQYVIQNDIQLVQNLHPSDINTYLANLLGEVFPDDEVKQVFFDDNVPENSTKSRGWAEYVPGRRSRFRITVISLIKLGRA